MDSLTYTAKQIDAFRENGFMKIPDAVPVAWVNKLRAALARLPDARNAADAFITGADGKEYFVNAGHLCNRKETVFLELLGSPMLLSLAEAICGSDFFPIQEFAVIKNKGDDNPVNWHQDVNNGAPGKTFMIGIYLDPADEDNGALRIVPGSQRSTQSICELEKQTSVSITMQAGDILVHDLMVAHSSGILKSLAQRRVVYFEFMSTQQAQSESIYPKEFIHLRTKLIPVALQFFNAAYPDSEHFQWKHPDRELFSPLNGLQQELDFIYGHHLNVKPANYCFDSLQNSIKEARPN